MRADHGKLRIPMALSTRCRTLNRGLWGRSGRHGECFLALEKACSEYRLALLIVQGSRDVGCSNCYSILETVDGFGERLIISSSLADRSDWTRLWGRQALGLAQSHPNKDIFEMVLSFQV